MNMGLNIEENIFSRLHIPNNCVMSEQYLEGSLPSRDRMRVLDTDMLTYRSTHQNEVDRMPWHCRESGTGSTTPNFRGECSPVGCG
jgi:hypothetical protein